MGLELNGVNPNFSLDDKLQGTPDRVRVLWRLADHSEYAVPATLHA
jgi:hypothetical protein